MKFHKKVFSEKVINEWVEKMARAGLMRSYPQWYARRHPPTKHSDYKRWRRWDRKHPRHRRTVP